MSEFDSVVLSGGGAKGLLQIGALHYYHQSGRYRQEMIREYAGTSIGSVIALAMIVGYEPMELFQTIHLGVPIFENESFNIWKMIEKMGALSFDPFELYIEDLLKKKGVSPDITFADLKKWSGKSLYISGVNLTEMAEERFDADLTPDMKVIDAVHISCNLPLIFQRYRHNNNFYIDGGLLNNYPWNYISKDCKSTLGLLVANPTSESLDSETLVGYIYRVIKLTISATSRELPKGIETVKLIDQTSEIFNLNLSQKRKMELFTSGFDFAESHSTMKIINVVGWN